MSIMSMKRMSAALLAAGAALVLGVPSALAAPLPNPEPVPMPEPVPGEGVPEANGNGQIVVSAPGVGVEGTNSETTGVPVNAVPNINGDSCTGGFESTVCYAEQMGDSPPPVEPRTSISSSP